MVNRIKELVKELNYHTDLYNKEMPEITDQQWDRMYFELQELEKETGIIYPNSPTQSIQYGVESDLKKVEHNHLMLSLAKCHSIGEVEEFVKGHEWIAMLKLDGLTCSLRYLDGKLVSAETRGDGAVGEDITHNIRVLNNVPQHIDYMEELIVDGEVIIDWNNFNQNFASEYKNPRNLASGTIRLLDAKECAIRQPKFIAWDCVKGLDNYQSLHEKLLTLKILGFDIVPYVSTNGTIEESINQLKKEKLYPIDGIVFKWDNCAEYLVAGATAHHFRGGLAFKFQDEVAESVLEDITYEVGRSGKLTPVAIFAPVELEGTTVAKASLHNLSIVREILGPRPYIGQKVRIKKANEIIPQLTEAEHWDGEAEVEFIKPLGVCPYCGEPTEVIQENESRFLYCVNNNCPSRILNQFEHFCSKNCMDIKGLSKQTLAKLLDWGWINNFVDLWYLGTMHRAEWVKKDGFGVASVDKILDAIEASREVELWRFLAALGIPLVGVNVAKDLAKYFGTWSEFIKAVETDFKFYVLPNFGPELHKNIKNFNYDEAKELVDTILTIKEPEVQETSTSLEGLTFVITGKLRSGSRDQIKERVEGAGGKVAGSVSSKTNYLVNNDVTSSSSKNLKAKDLGIPIISEGELLEMLGDL